MNHRHCDNCSYNQSVLPICCYPRSASTIMMPKSAVVHPFLPASSNGCIASTHMTSDSLIYPKPASFNPMIRPLSNSDSGS
ncbi:hypothetical protein TNCV_4081921 [Trichonephila clavipes]|nr:hypothetical protein TNCV_4081921 [Trichonephila clavipes]